MTGFATTALEQGFQYRQVPFNGATVSSRFSLRKDEILSVSHMIREKGVTLEVAHAACFLGFVALKTEQATIDEILGDFGLVHEAIHIMLGGPKTPSAASVEELADMAESIAGRLRGLPTSDIASWFDVDERCK